MSDYRSSADHDQPFKKLIQEFIKEFILLFYLRLMKRLIFVMFHFRIRNSSQIFRLGSKAIDIVAETKLERSILGYFLL